MEIGLALKKVRKSKGLKLKDLVTENLSDSQLSNIEKGKNIPSTEKFIQLLSKLNIRYDEFTPLLKDDYLKAKETIAMKPSSVIASKDLDTLEAFISETNHYYQLYQDIFFYHLGLVVRSGFILHKTHDFTLARENLQPIKDYLLKTTTWNAYELSLFGNCLYMFDIDDAIFFGNRASLSIKSNYHIYRNRELYSTLLNNLAIYTLDYKNHYLFALECANLSEEIAYSVKDTTSAISSKIITQVAYFKLQNGKFNKDYIRSLVETYKLIGWNDIYHEEIFFLKKHGIEIDE